MKKNEIMKNLSSVAAKATNKLQKHSPEILLYAGILGVATSAVIACVQTMKLNDVLTEAKERIDEAHKTGIDEESLEEVTIVTDKKELTMAYVHAGLELGKLYGLPVVVMGLSITSILASADILKKRNVAISAAYAEVYKSFCDYRERVIKKYGEETDKELRYNIKNQKIEVIETDPETGKNKKSKQTIQVADRNLHSDFACYFDESFQGYENSMDYNLMFLRAQQQWANDRLITTGKLFLNEVYEALGKEWTREGQVAGWIYDPDNGDGDNYVNFRIQEVNRETENGGYEPAIILDFNVDGNILDKI